MLINHFLINGEWYLVDLPGYGYARRSKRDTERLERIIGHYVVGREALTCLFVLIDSRLAPQRIDLEFIEMLGGQGVPFALIFTKADKNKGGELRRNVDRFLEALSAQWEELPPHFVTSSQRGTGREEILDYIQRVNDSLGR